MAVVFELDDLCDQWDPYDLLMKWKEAHPDGKVTLFTIPRRCSPELLEKYRALDWVELAMHGWFHTKGECLSWTSEDAQERLQAAEANGFVKGFKAPKWIMTQEVYAALEKEGWWVADHKNNALLWKNSTAPHYIYNERNEGLVAAHGHATNCCDNGIEEAWDTFQFPPETEFKFVSEVVSV